MHFETTVEIDAPHDRVWATMADVERWPEWTASMRELKILDGTTIALGSRVRIVMPRLPTLVWEVTEFEPGASFTWRGASRGVATIGTHSVRATAASRVAVTLGIRESGPLAPVTGLLLPGLIRRYVQMEADGLKHRCEAG